MSDLIIIGVIVTFSWEAAFTRTPATNFTKIFMETIFVGVVSLLLFIYLLVAMIKPEKFKGRYELFWMDAIRSFRRVARCDHKADGNLLTRVLDANGRTWLDLLLRPLERLMYALMGVDPKKEHDWKQYTVREFRSLQVDAPFDRFLIFYRIVGDTLEVRRLISGERDIRRRLAER